MKDGPLAAGRALAERGLYAEAVGLFRKALEGAALAPAERAAVLHLLGSLLLYSDEKDRALEEIRAAREWAVRAGLPAEAAAFEKDMAIQKAYAGALELRSSGRLPESSGRFDEAGRLAGLAGAPEYELRVVSAWSLNYFAPGDRDKGLELNLRALSLANSLDFRREVSRASSRIGACYALKNDYSRALSYFLKALNTPDEGRDGSDLVTCLNNIAVMYMSLGDYVKSKDYLLEASSHLAEGPAGTFQASLLVSLGDLFAAIGRRLQDPDFSRKALDCFSAYLDLKGPGSGGPLRPGALAGMAGIFLDQGRLEEARKMLAPALDEARSSGSEPLTTGRAMALMGEWSLRTGDIAEAERYFREARALSLKAESPLLTMSAAYGLGRCAEARGDFGRAIEDYNIAVGTVGEAFLDIAGDIHQAEFIGRARDPFQALVRLYLDLARGRGDGFYAGEIFRLSESVRARSFAELGQRLSRDGRRSDQAARGSTETKELGLERIEALKAIARGGLSLEGRKRLEARVVQLDDLLDDAVFSRFGGGKAPSLPFRPVSPAFLQGGVLDDRTVLVEYLLGDTKSVLFCLGKDTFRLIELPGASELYDALTGFLSFLEDPTIPAAKGVPAARRLYRLLLAPVEPYFPARTERLVIVPDGFLFRLPFEALALPGPRPGPPVYVNDRYTVSYAPSASSLVAAAPRTASRFAKDVLAFGASNDVPPAVPSAGPRAFTPGGVLDDIYERRGFAFGPIPHVRDEIADLRRRVAPGAIDVYQGPEAAEGTLKGLDLRAYRLIHLAGHAFSDDDRPLRSALLLAAGAGGREDGYLQVSEMYDLRTNADLVVLSACQSGRGRTVMNEGNLGLPRVFFTMGARSVLSTLWPISDRAGATFMRHFYDAYFRGLGKAASLRAAKKAMQGSRYAHPFYWASYVLTGGF